MAFESLSGKAAFLQDGEVWISGLDGTASRVTDTGGKVEGYIFSPGLEYLAYSKVIRYVDEPGLYEEGEDVPQRSVCSIVFAVVATRAVVAEVEPAEGWIYPLKWVSAGVLFCSESSGLDVSGFFTYDVAGRERTELDYNRGSILLGACFSDTDSLMAYVTDSGLGPEYQEHLHVLSQSTGEDTIIASRRSVADPAFSPGHRSIAFLEVESQGGRYFDNLWVCRIDGGGLRRLYRGPSRPKSGGVDALSWAPDGKRVGYFLPPEALLFDADGAETPKTVKGRAFAWAGSALLLVSRGPDIWLVNIDSGQEKLFRKNATEPQFLR
jgi:hypothetical protein